MDDETFNLSLRKGFVLDVWHAAVQDGAVAGRRQRGEPVYIDRSQAGSPPMGIREAGGHTRPVVE